MGPKPLPDLGYDLEQIFVVEQMYRLVPPHEIPPQVEGDLTAYSWDWFANSAETFYVRLGARTAPWEERPEEVNAVVVGAFGFGDEPRMDFRTFVCREAPAILFPYLRETLSALTSRGLHEAYYHPPVDIAQIIEESFRFEDASGAHVVAGRPELREVYGIPAPSALPASKPRGGAKKKSTGRSRARRRD